MEQYAKAMGGDVNMLRNAFRPAAAKQARVNVTLAKIVEEAGITVSEEETEAEYAALAKQYEMEADKVKGMVPAEEIKTSLETRKAIRLIVDSAIPTEPKPAEEAGQEAAAETPEQE